MSSICWNGVLDGAGCCGAVFYRANVNGCFFRGLEALVGLDVVINFFTGLFTGLDY